MTELEILKSARALITDPEHWCQGSYAQDNAGVTCLPIDPSAYCFCALGAVQRVRQQITDHSGIVVRLNNAAIVFGLHGGITSLNDDDEPEIAHKRVLQAFDLAIKRLERP